MQSMENYYFCTLYTKFQAGANWLAKREAQGLDNNPHLAKFRQLEIQVDGEWKNMPNDRKDAILALLVERGAIPGEIIEIKEMFGGELVKIT